MTVKQILAAAAACICCVSSASCVRSDVPGSQPEISVGDEGVGEVITPDPESLEADLGDYRFSSTGVKLYYDSTQIPTGIMLALEKYFTSYAQRDYETYKTCVYPGYVDSMEAYLQSEYGYGQEESFGIQCDNLNANAGGDFTVTRVRAEQTGSESMEPFFSYLNECFGEDYYDQISKDSDSMYDLYFSIMVKPEGSEEETLLISDFEIVFAEKDGVYYTFG
ncbi:MAG: hypothetical protein IJ071_07680 [Ruminococcus sp.]|nr:hypothetical protein [Ruminococcus sp.]